MKADLKLVKIGPLELDEWARLLMAARDWKQAYSHLRKELPTRALCWLVDIHEEGLVPEITIAIQKLCAWFDGDERSCGIAVLSGPPGVGKTIAASWLLLRRLALQYPKFVTAARLASMPRYGEDREVMFGADVLLLDDLGAEHATSPSAWLADVDQLVDGVYADQRYLICTTNLNQTDFSQRYGARVWDRLAECGTWITVTGKSMRGGTKR